MTKFSDLKEMEGKNYDYVRSTDYFCGYYKDLDKYVIEKWTVTTTPHVPTKEEILKGLPLYGELYVPIVDESMSRLGWTTESLNMTATEAPIKAPKVESAIKVVLRTMNLNNTNEQEWLAFETVLGPKHQYEKECAAESCQSRCYKTSCDSVCTGDTCASGCVGVSCNAVVIISEMIFPS
nr:uncharacterized protein LOC110381359 [Helicoverpa armigera]